MSSDLSHHAEPIRLPAGLRLLRRFDFPRKLGILERLYGHALTREECAWVETAAGPVWKLDLRSNSHRWIVYGDYEGPKFIPWTRRWLRSGDIVIDSGANNIGQTTARPGVRVLAFEPNPDSRAWLEECLRLYAWDVEVIPAGLSDVAGDMPLKVPLFEGETDAQATLHQDWYAQREVRQVSVNVITMDAFLRDRRIEKIRLWKLDVEGWEFNALNGARESLKRQAFDAIHFEVVRPNLEACLQLLESASYQLFHLEPGAHVVKGLPRLGQQMNALAIAPRKRT